MKKMLLNLLIILLFIFSSCSVEKDDWIYFTGELNNIEFHQSSSAFKTSVTVLTFKDGTIFSYPGIPIPGLNVKKKISLKYTLFNNYINEIYVIKEEK